MSALLRLRGRRGTLPLVLLAAVAAVLLGGRGSFAFWTGSATIPGTTIHSGSVDVKLNGADNDSTSFATLGVSGLTPGGSTAVVITVSNGGASPLTYYVDAAASNADGKGLGAALVVRLTGAAAVTGTGTARSCGGAVVPGSGTSFAPNLVPSASPRSLAPGSSETFCLQATLPDVPPYSTTTAYQNASTDVTLAVHASQVIS